MDPDTNPRRSAMTDQQPLDAAEPTIETPAEEASSESAASSRAREWLSQLETMIQNVAREATPVAREVGAKAAELAAVAAVKAGPAAQKAAAVTTEYGQRFAEKAQSVAADWRHENEAAKAVDETPAEADTPKELTAPSA
jgi:hypothetical protein